MFTLVSTCIAVQLAGVAHASTLRVPSAFPTIQDGIDSAAAGDTVLVAAGLYRGEGFHNLDYAGKNIVVRSESGPAVTILDAEWSGRGVDFNDGEGPLAVLEGFTITRGIVSEWMGGGILCRNGSSPTIVRCVLANNWASGLVVGRGAGIAILESSAPTLIECTIAENTAYDDSEGARGSGLYCSNSTATLIRTLVAGNCDDDIALASTSIPVRIECCAFSAISGDGDYELIGESVTEDPGVCDLRLCADPDTLADPLRLQLTADSPCRAENSPCGERIGALDVNCTIGACCFDDGHCEMLSDIACSNRGGDYRGEGVLCASDPCPPSGACCFEHGGCAVLIESVCLAQGGDYLGDGVICASGACPSLVVHPDGSGDHPTIQAAVDAAGTWATIELSDGVFSGPGNRDIELRGKNLVIRSQSGEAESCILDAEGTAATPHRAFYIHSGEPPTTKIQSLTLRGGYNSLGGAIHFDFGARATVEDCVLSGNHADYGGAIFCRNNNTDPTIVRCRIAGNDASVRGGGIDCTLRADPKVSECSIYGNRAPAGSGIGIRQIARPVIEQCIISFGLEGAAVHCEESGVAYLSCCDVFANEGGDWVGCIAEQFPLRNNFSADPLFCDAASGDFSVAANSPCLPSGNDCGLLVGPIGEGCVDLDAGACCLNDSECVVCSEMSCAALGGLSWDPLAGCDPNPCPSSGACCFKTDGRCEILPEDPCTSSGGEYLGAGIECAPGSCPVRVAPDGTGDFVSIQDAVDAVVEGAVIELADGRFTGSGNRDIDLSGKAITIRSESGDPSTCILDCEGSALQPHRGFVFDDGETAQTRLESVTIEGGYIDYGGAILVGISAKPTVTDCIFRDNVASYGGALSVRGNFQTDPQLYDCVFLDNRALVRGGGMDCTDGSRGNLIRCTFYGNAAPQASQIGVVMPTAPTIEHSILAFGVGGDAVTCPANSELAFGCSIFFGNEGGDWPLALARHRNANGNFSADPLFCNPSAGDLSVAANSPCLSANNECAAPIGASGEGCGALSNGACCFYGGDCLIAQEENCDAQGGTWLGESSTCEVNPCAPIVLRSDGSGEFPSIQAAVDAAQSGWNIVLEDGTYRGPGNRDINLLGKSLAIRSLHGEPELCIIDCEGSTTQWHRAFTLQAQEGPATTIEGITIANGYNNTGGGVLMSSGVKATVRDCVFRNNWARYGGGIGTVGDGTDPTLERCVFLGNEGTIRGGGLDCFSGASPSVRECTFYGNESPKGSAMGLTASSIVPVERSILSFGLGGRAVYCDGSQAPTFSCSDIYGNDGGNWVACISGQATQRDNFSADPLFCDPEDGDLTLRDGSPCRAENSPCGQLVGAVPGPCLDPTDVPSLEPMSVASLSFALLGPNPTRETVRFSVGLPRADHVVVRAFDAGGRSVGQVVDQLLAPGMHSLAWDPVDEGGRRLASGIYQLQLRSGSESKVTRVVLIR